MQRRCDSNPRRWWTEAVLGDDAGARRRIDGGGESLMRVVVAGHRAEVLGSGDSWVPYVDSEVGGGVRAWLIVPPAAAPPPVEEAASPCPSV